MQSRAIPMSVIFDIDVEVFNFVQKKYCWCWPRHRKKNESCVTQANTGYLEKAKFILCQIDPWIN